VKYYAKLNNVYLNVISLYTNPNRLRDTRTEKEAICYSDNEIKYLLKLYPNIQIEIFKLYTKKYYVTRN
jgi:hypothetical protein